MQDKNISRNRLAVTQRTPFVPKLDTENISPTVKFSGVNDCLRSFSQVSKGSKRRSLSCRSLFSGAYKVQKKKVVKHQRNEDFGQKSKAGLKSLLSLKQLDGLKLKLRILNQQKQKDHLMEIKHCLQKMQKNNSIKKFKMLKMPQQSFRDAGQSRIEQLKGRVVRQAIHTLKNFDIQSIQDKNTQPNKYLFEKQSKQKAQRMKFFNPQLSFCQHSLLMPPSRSKTQVTQQNFKHIQPQKRQAQQKKHQQKFFNYNQPQSPKEEYLKDYQLIRKKDKGIKNEYQKRQRKPELIQNHIQDNISILKSNKQQNATSMVMQSQLYQNIEHPMKGYVNPFSTNDTPKPLPIVQKHSQKNSKGTKQQKKISQVEEFQDEIQQIKIVPSKKKSQPTTQDVQTKNNTENSFEKSSQKIDKNQKLKSKEEQKKQAMQQYETKSNKYSQKSRSIASSKPIARPPKDQEEKQKMLCKFNKNLRRLQLMECIGQAAQNSFNQFIRVDLNWQQPALLLYQNCFNNFKGFLYFYKQFHEYGIISVQAVQDFSEQVNEMEKKLHQRINQVKNKGKWPSAYDKYLKSDIIPQSLLYTEVKNFLNEFDRSAYSQRIDLQKPILWYIDSILAIAILKRQKIGINSQQLFQSQGQTIEETKKFIKQRKQVFNKIVFK